MFARLAHPTIGGAEREAAQHHVRSDTPALVDVVEHLVTALTMETRGV